MPTLIFLAYKQLAWVARLPENGPPLEVLAHRAEAGKWPLPEAWLVWLERHFLLPDPLVLRAQVHGRLLVLAPHPALLVKRPGAAQALHPPRVIHPLQREILRQLAAGQPVDSIAWQLGRSPRWVKYQLRAIRTTRAGSLRAARKKIRG